MQRNRPLIVLIYFLCVAVSPFVNGQDEKKKKEDTTPKPRSVTLKTRDGVTLRAFYFPSDKGKDAIPILFVHEWQGQASPYAKLVVALRDAGCAVLVPDYRGHGGSKEFVDAKGKTQTFNLSTMNKRDIENILAADLEEAKQFLKHENDEGKLNLNALVVIGVREGAILASHFASRDWKWPSIGSKKQGQDVKAVVMISPEKLVKGVAIDAVLTDPTFLRLPIMIVVGDSSAEAPEATRIVKRIEVFKKKVGQGNVTGLKEDVIKTSLSGPSLVNESEKVIPAIVEFVKNNVSISKEENPWVQRGGD